MASWHRDWWARPTSSRWHPSQGGADTAPEILSEPLPLIRYKKMERQSLQVRLGPDGVEVRLPLWVSVRDPGTRRVVEEQLAHAAQDAPREPDPAAPLTRKALQADVMSWASLVGVAPNRTQVRRMSSRWGSCTSKGNVTFSNKVLEMPATLRDYLICHELVHLRVLNHGPEFQRLMATVMPDWRKREKWLAGWVARRELRAMSRGRSRRQPPVA